MSELAFTSATELAARIAARTLSPRDLVDAYLDRIDAHDAKLKGFLTVCREQAVAEAGMAEKEARAGRLRGPLHGVPIGLKDLFATAGVRTTAGSRILGEWVPDRDAAVVARLKAAGAIVLGKLHMHEFAYGPEGRNAHHGDPWNPWDPRVHRIAGGSSSGSAVAVAAGLCAAALGSDTGGSIRLPSALCNLVGLKPTFGRLSTDGVVPLAWSLDHVGPMTRTAADAALLFGVMAGTPAPVLSGDIRGLRIGLLRPFFLERATPSVARAVESAASQFEALGAQVDEAAIEGVEHAAAAFLAIVWPEALAYHQRWMRSRPQDYDPTVRDRLRLGAFVSAVDHLNGQRFRQLLRARTEALLARYDLLLAPATPITASPLDQDEVVLAGERRDRRGALILYTQVFNLTGHPAVSVPCGFDPDGMPIGMQLVGRADDEGTVLRAADAYQRATDWHLRRP